MSFVPREDQLRVMREMARLGANAGMIGRHLGWPTKRASKVASDYLIALRKAPKCHSLRFTLDEALNSELRAEAERRGVPATNLVRIIVGIAIRDRLIDALIDVEETKLPSPCVKGDSEARV